jgi:hypothetical protein
MSGFNFIDFNAQKEPNENFFERIKTNTNKLLKSFVFRDKKFTNNDIKMKYYNDVMNEQIILTKELDRLMKYDVEIMDTLRENNTSTEELLHDGVKSINAFGRGVDLSKEVF